MNIGKEMEIEASNNETQMVISNCQVCDLDEDECGSTLGLPLHLWSQTSLAEVDHIIITKELDKH